MLGYVKIYKPELKMKEYELYRGLYCSLCKALGKQYGILSRLMLSYDITFLVLVVLAVQDINPKFKKGRCPFDPAKKCNYCTNADEQFNFAAAVTVIMFYFKICDNIEDGGFFRRIAMYLILPYAAFKRKKAASRYSELDRLVSQSMANQRKVEKSLTASVDKAAHNSADALGRILNYENDEHNSLYKFGYFVGRWVYLVDAVDDLEKDIKSGSYNVFAERFNLSRDEQLSEDNVCEIQETLNLTLAETAKAYNDLNVTILFPIIENIIFESMSNTMNNVLKGIFKNERSV